MQDELEAVANHEVQVTEQANEDQRITSRPFSPNSNKIFDDKQLNDANHLRLDFIDVSLDVQVKGKTKRILNNVSGFAKAGELLYIMGPSGSGKTTLLDYLTNRTKSHPKGQVFFNKQKWTQQEFSKVAKYCQQHPQLYECLTVQETLDYAAQFQTTNSKDRQKRVMNAIEMLGLQGQKDVKVGGIFYRGISGGQKQRVSVGEQIVADPKILFLDEPTSGLDSAAAYQLMQKLKDIAKKTNLTIVSSIHQPSQRVFSLSDRLLLLAGGERGGNVAYFGETSKVVDFFKQVKGGDIKEEASASEWILDEVNGDFGNTEHISNIIEKFKQSEYKKDQEKEQDFYYQQNNQNSQELEHYKYKGVSTKQSWFGDVWTIIKRAANNNLKNPLVIWIRIIMYSAMAFVLGTVWIGIGDNLKQGDVQNLCGVLFFMAAFLAFMQICILPSLLEDKAIMIKEKTNGFYSLSAYFVGNFLVQVPLTFLLALISGSIAFFAVEMENDGGAPYLIFVTNLFVTLVAAESLILLVSYIFNHLLICIVISCFAFGTFMVLQGFFIKVQDIPLAWRWLSYVGFHTYSFSTFMINTFENITVKKDMDIYPPSPFDYDGKIILEQFDMDDHEIGINFVVMICMIFFYRSLAFIWSSLMHKGKK